MFLFIDTTYVVTVGLLNEEFKWVGYKRISSNKSSLVLHEMIHESLEEANKQA